jgi:tRNA(Ile)-lysidine synthase TilS/MesJ
MECDHCRRDAILFQPYSGQHLCARHLTLDVERRAKRVIRKNGWISPGDRIAVVAEGDARSRALLHFLVSVFGARRDLSFVVVTLDEEDGPCSRTLGEVREKCGLEPIRGSQEVAIPIGAGNPTGGEYGREPWRTWRGQRIQQVARERHATRIALGSSVEDEAYAMLSDLLRGSLSSLSPQEDELPCIRPFMTIPEREVLLYGRLHAGVPDSECGIPCHRYDDIRAALEEFTSRHPATPFSLAHLRAALVQASEGPVSRFCRRPGEDISSETEVPEEQQEE